MIFYRWIMNTTLKTVVTIIAGSFLILFASVSQAGNFSINIGYSNFGYRSNYLPYSYKAFSHPRSIYYSSPPVRVYNYGIPVSPNYHHHFYQPGYTINYIYYVDPGKSHYYKDNHKHHNRQQDYYSPGRYYKPKKIYMYKK